MHIMNTTQTAAALFILCLLIVLAIVFRTFVLPKLPVKIAKILQLIAICCVIIAFLITGYTIFFSKK